MTRGTAVLITGMSGTGKSTVLQALAQHGHASVDTDEPGWLVTGDGPDGPEPLWDLERVTELLDRHGGDVLFVGGCVANQGALYHRFDAIVLLTAPVEVLLERVSNRVNPFGSRSEDREKIAADAAVYEPVLRARADHEIVTTGALADVVRALEQIAGVPDRRRAEQRPRNPRI